MALSVVDLYTRVLPRTNCRDCGYPTCLAFAGMVVSQRHPLKNCPHIDPDVLPWALSELEEQYKQGKWLKKDMAKEALEWAKQRAASIKPEDIAPRIGGTFIRAGEKGTILLPCFDRRLSITMEGVRDESGRELSQNEQTFVYIHMARGGDSKPTGKMKSLKEFPNTVSKIVTLRERVETPLKNTFSEDPAALFAACKKIRGIDVQNQYPSCDLAFQFHAFPKVPVVLLFWKAADGFEADVKLLFDETILQHLDIEAILFLSEHLCRILTA
nr:DUF3786 domain-containing protein [Desulfobacula sp.]